MMLLQVLSNGMFYMLMPWAVLADAIRSSLIEAGHAPYTCTFASAAITAVIALLFFSGGRVCVCACLRSALHCKWSIPTRL